jgi:hypothetical protein
MIYCRFDNKGNWPTYFDPICRKLGITPETNTLIDLWLTDEANKKVELVEFKDTDWRSSVYRSGRVDITQEFARMITQATQYRLKGYLVKLHCIFMQPEIPNRIMAHDYPMAKSVDQAKDWLIRDLQNDIVEMKDFLNVLRLFLSQCDQYGVQPLMYGDKAHAAESPFKRLLKRWGLDLSIPPRCLEEPTLLATILTCLPGVSGENAARWSQQFDHNLNCFLECWANNMNRFKAILRMIFPPNKDGTDCQQFSDLYELFYNDKE